MTASTEYLARHLWAKTDPFHFLWQHLLDTAAAAEALLPRFVPTDCLPLSPEWLCYLVALHDIGKADPLFQFKADDFVQWEGGTNPAFTPAFAARTDFAEWKAAGLTRQVAWDRTRGFRHEARSYSWLHGTHLPALGWGKSATLVAATAVRGHHADFDATAIIEEGAVPGRWNPLRDALAALVADAVGLNPETHPAPQDFSGAHASRVGLILSGLIVLSDWIASNEKLFPFETIAALDDPREYLAAAKRLAKAAVASLHFDAGPVVAPARPPKFADVWVGDAYNCLRPTQIALEAAVVLGDMPPGLAIIEAPMGEGKTEAAIYLAEAWNRATGRVGTYIALPTQATSNQMFGRYEAFLKATRPALAPRLLHGMAWLRERPTGDTDTVGKIETSGADGVAEGNRAAEWFYDNAKRGLLAPESVGTVDQVLFAALNVRHGFLRLFGLSARTLIVDEAHAYDDFMTAILCRLLTWLHALRVPTILLSATLSRVQKAKLLAAYGGVVLPDTGEEAYPLITLAPLDAPAKSVPVTIPVTGYDRPTSVTLKTVSGALQNAPVTATLAAKLVAGGGCLCVLLNTVKQAQAVFSELETLKTAGRLTSDCELSLFHARFPARRRNAIEKSVTEKFGKGADGKPDNPKRPKCAILVATQVVEQSLDVDFDAMISEIAPIDLLLQRSGRLHRHDRGDTRPALLKVPVLHVLALEAGGYEFGSTGVVYEPFVLLRTLALLTAGGDNSFVFHAPTGFRPAIESVYAPDSAAPLDVALADAIGAARDKWETHTAVKENAGNVHLVAEPKPKSFCYASPKPAVDEDTDGESPRSYLRAKTRYDDGEPTRSVLVLTGPDDFKAWSAAQKFTGNARPPKKALRQLFLCKASVPWRWLKGVPDVPKGLAEMRWLQGHAVLKMCQEKNMPGRFRFDDAAVITRLWSDELRGLYEEKVVSVQE